MKQKIPVIAIFDVGKTNKKLLIFDEEYRVVKEETTSFEEIKDDEGFACENIDALTDWILARFQALKQSDEFQLKAVNFSTYGASLVYVDKQGKRLGYLYNYLKPYPEEVLAGFLSKRGGSIAFAESSSSPVMGHLNAGLQLYWLKHRKPELFSRVDTVLHLPQYLSFLITGSRVAEMTNLGCHSAMWNFEDMRYHEWLQQEGLSEKLATVIKGDSGVACANECRQETIWVGVGLHDSSAATIPYLSSFKEPFVILSTGTWVISLNPFNSELPTGEELQKGCLSYLTYQGNPVKTSMLFAGNDHDKQVEAIAQYFNIAPGYLRSMKYNKDLIASLQLRNQSGPPYPFENLNSPTTPCAFHQRQLSSFLSADEAYHQLLLDMLEQQVHSTGMVLKNSPIKHIYVDGGFCRNNIYMQLLANAFADKKIFATSMIQGTALGAALAVHQKWNAWPLPSQLIKLKEWTALQS